jgi:hypothetical protein
MKSSDQILAGCVDRRYACSYNHTLVFKALSDLTDTLHQIYEAAARNDLNAVRETLGLSAPTPIKEDLPHEEV